MTLKNIFSISVTEIPQFAITGKTASMIDKRLLKIFYDLIKIDALSGFEKPVADYIMNFLKCLDLSPFIEKHSSNCGSNTGNVICKLGNGGNYILLSHMDTARSTKNVNPVVHNDRITSGGNTVLGVDNRAGIAAILFALESAVTNKIPLNDFTVAFTVQEETTLAGSKNLYLDKNINAGFIFDSHLRPGNFICESCGDAGFNLKIIGKASHSGIAPEDGISSIKIACGAISEIELGRIDPDTTANIGIIKGGTAVNVVPELTEIEGEVRSGNLDKVISKLNEIKSKFEKYADQSGAKLEFSYKWDFKPYKIKPTSEVYRRIVSVLTAVGLDPNPKSSWGGSDANSLNEKGIESVNIGIGAENPHSNEEFILLDDLLKSSEIALELMKK